MNFGQDVPAVSMDELVFALSVRHAAYSGAMPTPNPENHKFTIGGTEEEFALRDIPLNRAMVAVMREAGPNAEAIVWRMMIIPEVLRDQKFKRWIRKDEMGAPLMEAIATFPCKFGRRWGRQRLLQLARRIEVRDKWDPFRATGGADIDF